MTIAQKINVAGYSGAYLLGKGVTSLRRLQGPNKAARVNSQIAAFIEAFVNGSYQWTQYFCDAIFENNKVGQVPFHANFKKRISARLSITIGAGDAMISYPNIDEIKNVLHQARTNPQTA